MRVWVLKETKSFCTSCATGCNTVIGTREDVIYRQTPRENDAVNSCWMCDYGRLNFDDVHSERRLLEPRVLQVDKLAPTDWKTAISTTAMQLRHFTGWSIAIIASGRMTNEEMWLTSRIAQTLGVQSIDIVPREGPSDDILLSRDRNPNTNGARVLGLTEQPGARLPGIIEGVTSGAIQALVLLGEDPLECGFSREQLQNLPALIMMSMLQNDATELATSALPSVSFAEKRGSMINGKGRLQRLNRAVRPPGNARDDWEILRDLYQALTGSNGVYTIDDVFRQMSEAIPALAGLTLSNIGDLGKQILTVEESPVLAEGQPN
jgi:NADH-quinone oxidoreductase subunit G